MYAVEVGIKVSGLGLILSELTELPEFRHVCPVCYSFYKIICD